MSVCYIFAVDERYPLGDCRYRQSGSGQVICKLIPAFQAPPALPIVSLVASGSVTGAKASRYGSVAAPLFTMARYVRTFNCIPTLRDREIASAWHAVKGRCTHLGTAVNSSIRPKLIACLPSPVARNPCYYLSCEYSIDGY